MSSLNQTLINTAVMLNVSETKMLIEKMKESRLVLLPSERIIGFLPHDNSEMVNVVIQYKTTIYLNPQMIEYIW